MKIRQTKIFELDIEKERLRINKYFKEETKVKLHNLMTYIEDENWTKAWEELTGEWWQGTDKEKECSRLEFIGQITHQFSYADLVSHFIYQNDYGEGKWEVLKEWC